MALNLSGPQESDISNLFQAAMNSHQFDIKPALQGVRCQIYLSWEQLEKVEQVISSLNLSLPIKVEAKLIPIERHYLVTFNG